MTGSPGPGLQPHVFTVGEPWMAGRTRYTEGAEYNYRAGHHELRIFWGTLTPGDVRAIRYSTTEWALLVDGPIVFLLYRIHGVMAWSETPYTIWAVDAAERWPPPPFGQTTQHALISIFLIDADTGILRAIRQVTWSPAFTAAVHLAIAAQFSAGPADPAVFDQALVRARAHYPTVEAMAAAASSRTYGGR